MIMLGIGLHLSLPVASGFTLSGGGGIGLGVSNLLMQGGDNLLQQNGTSVFLLQ